MSYWQLGGRAHLPVNQIGTQLRKIKVRFAPQSRGKQQFDLHPPVVTNTPPPVLRNIVVLLAEPTRVRVRSKLGAPNN